VRCARALRAGDDLKLNGFTFRKRTEAFTQDCSLMHEDILLAIDRSESKTLRIVEPLDCSGDFLLTHAVLLLVACHCLLFTTQRKSIARKENPVMATK